MLVTKILLCALLFSLAFVFCETGWRLVLRRWLPLLICGLSFATFALDRTSVTRVPVGTSGSITAVNVTAIYYEYVSGSPVGKYKMTWTETPSTGAQTGSRLWYSATVTGSFGTGTAISGASQTAAVAAFYASCAVEDPDNDSAWSDSPQPLTGFVWFTSPPNDTATWAWSTGTRSPEDDPAPPWDPPVASGEYWPLVATVAPGSLGYVMVSDLVWPGTEPGVVAVDCRQVRAFCRVENIPPTQRNISLVWDERLNDETTYRYHCRFSNNVGSPWQNTVPLVWVGRQISLTSDTGTAGAFSLTGTNFGSGNGWLARSIPAAFGPSSMQDYRQVISRFLAAYHRDHGVSTDVVKFAFENAAGLAYYPEEPTGMLAFNWLGGAGDVPRFNRCGDGEEGGGTGGSGTYTGPPSSAFPTSTLPSGAGESAAPAAVVSTFQTALGNMISNPIAFTGLDQGAEVVELDIVLPGQTEASSYSLSTMPDTESPLGVALEAFRLLLRGALSVCIIYKCCRKIYADIIIY